MLDTKVKCDFAVRSFDPVHEKCDIFDGTVQLFGACHRQEIDGVVFIQELSAAGFFGRFYIIHAVIFGLKSVVDPVFITAEILNGAVGQIVEIDLQHGITGTVVFTDAESGEIPVEVSAVFEITQIGDVNRC